MSKGSARVQFYDKLGNHDLIDDSVSSQNPETGFVWSNGMFARRKMFRLGRSVETYSSRQFDRANGRDGSVVQNVQAVQNDR
jgi:hypothetical protein